VSCDVVSVAASYDVENEPLRSLASSSLEVSSSCGRGNASCISSGRSQEGCVLQALRRTVNVRFLWTVLHMLRRNGGFIVFGWEL
jgi:hypothetical protein